MKIYTTFFAIFFNCIFAVCLNYSLFALRFMCTSNFVTEADFLIVFFIYNIIWLVVDFRYNAARYQKQGAGLSFWLPVLFPAIIIFLLLEIVILLF